jgi:hypothetical protein
MGTWIFESNETVEEIAERVAKAWHERPCPPEDGDHCNADLHDWDRAHPFDKEWGRDHVRFVLTELGFG